MGTYFTGIAQLVEHWSPKPGVGSSSLSSRAKIEIICLRVYQNTAKIVQKNFCIKHHGQHAPNLLTVQWLYYLLP